MILVKHRRNLVRDILGGQVSSRKVYGNPRNIDVHAFPALDVTADLPEHRTVKLDYGAGVLKYSYETVRPYHFAVGLSAYQCLHADDLFGFDVYLGLIVGNEFVHIYRLAEFCPYLV